MLQILFYRRAAGQHSFLYRAVNIWNDLPDVLPDSVNSFKYIRR